MNKIQVFIFISIILFGSCSKKESSYGAMSSASPEMSRQTIELSDDVENIQPKTIRKLIVSSNLSIRIENLDDGVNKLNEIINKYTGSYASSIRINENSRDYTLKVPENRYKMFLEEIMEIGKIIKYNETTEDVTLRYYDLESRLNTKRELIMTFQNYLARADSIEEILSVESRIAQLQAEIDDVGRQFQLLGNSIDYSTIRLELLGSISSGNYGKETLGERVKSIMAGFGNYISTIAVILLGIVVYVTPLVIIILLLYIILFGRIGILRKGLKFGSGKKE